MVSKKGAKLLIGLGIGAAIIGFFISAIVDNEILGKIGSLVGALGCGTLGGSVGIIYQHKKYEKNPDKKKQSEIEMKDERSNLIREKAAAKAGNITNWMFLGVAYICIILNLPTWLVMLIIGIFVLKVGLEIMFIKKYNEEL